MLRMRGVAIVCLLLGTALGLAGQVELFELARKDLEPRLVHFAAEPISVARALEALRESGNAVRDLRKNKRKDTFSFGKTTALPFWEALDRISQQAGCAISLYEPEGGVALIDGKPRDVPTYYQGIFRIANKRTVLSRDEGTDQHSCTVTLEVAWEPRNEPLFLDVGPMRARFAADDKKKELTASVSGSGKMAVAGRTAVEMEVRLPAPDRTAPKLASLEGSLKALGPGKMLTFVFGDLKPPAQGKPAPHQMRDGVRVSLTHIKPRSDSLSVHVLIENPKGTPQFESYQSWLDNNRIHLEKGEGDRKQVITLPFGAEEELGPRSALQAKMGYHFSPAPGDLEGWKLVYRTPGPMVEMDVPFQLKDLRLP
ncbi:MAG: hypothetical protein L0215_17960 [Gemmataceae bacterium]|nr:hypothetical protein [Gemmataceae bacterium]